LPAKAGKEETLSIRCPQRLARKKLGRFVVSNRWRGRNSVDSMSATAGEEETRSIRCPQPLARKKLGRFVARKGWRGKNSVGGVSATDNAKATVKDGISKKFN